MMFDGDETGDGMGGDDAAMPETPSEGGDMGGGDAMPGADAGTEGESTEGGM